MTPDQTPGFILKRMSTLTIGRLAKAAGVAIDTIRYYEREGLLPEPPRRASGYRAYPPETVRRLRFIRGAKQLGFSLKEIAELLELRNHRSDERDEVRSKAREKIRQIDQRVAEMIAIRDELKVLVSACEHEQAHGGADCPILGALERGLDSGRSS